MGVKVSGFRELRRAIRKLDPELRNSVWGEMSKDTRELRNEIRQAAPVKTGTLKKNVKTKLIKGELFAAVTIGPDAHYWLFVEKGTSKMPAHPFIRPVWESAQNRIRADLEAGIKRIVDRPPK